jgi:hypothetical protein
MGKGALDATSAQMCRAEHCAGVADATGSPGQARAFTWSPVVDNHPVAVEGTWSTRFYLVEGHPATQPGSTLIQLAQKFLVQSAELVVWSAYLSRLR